MKEKDEENNGSYTLERDFLQRFSLKFESPTKKAVADERLIKIIKELYGLSSSNLSNREKSIATAKLGAACSGPVFGYRKESEKTEKYYKQIN